LYPPGGYKYLHRTPPPGRARESSSLCLVLRITTNTTTPSQLQDQERSVPTPFPTSSSITGPGLQTHCTAGTLGTIDPSTTREGHDVQGRRDPAGNRHEGGSGEALRRTEPNQANDTTTSESQNTGERAPTLSKSQDAANTDDEGTR